MEFTVHTSFRALNEATKKIQGFSQIDKIEAPDKLTAKGIAWQRILESREFKFPTLGSQSARVAREWLGTLRRVSDDDVRKGSYKDEAVCYKLDGGQMR